MLSPATVTVTHRGHGACLSDTSDDHASSLFLSTCKGLGALQMLLFILSTAQGVRNYYPYFTDE